MLDKVTINKDREFQASPYSNNDEFKATPWCKHGC